MSDGATKVIPTYYRALEIDPRARPAVVKAAYHALAKEFHPDCGTGDADAMRHIIEAYQVLSNQEERANYDRFLAVKEGLVVGNYRVKKEIAEGGFGVTYLGEHLIAREPVCIKHCHRVSPVFEDALIAEAKAIWDLRHYSLPVMRDFVRLGDGSLALVMSYIPGPTLEQVVKKAGALDPELVSWITTRVLNALMYLHYHGVVHGDIKPQNLIIQPESHQVVLVDFGLSMVKPTRTSDPKGYTPVFSSPEQLAGLPLLPESDLYSLGMTMLFALSGSAEKAYRLEVPVGTPEPLCDFVKRLLLRDVHQRPNWKKEDLRQTFETVRQKSFGRTRSDLKPIPGF